MSRNQIWKDYIAVGTDASPLSFGGNGTLYYDKKHALLKGAEKPGETVDREYFEEAVKEVKTAAALAAKELIADFRKRFPSGTILDAFAVLQPHFWRKADYSTDEAKEKFLKGAKKKFDKLLSFYGKEIKLGKDTVKPLVDKHTATAQWSTFQNVMENTRDEIYEGQESAEFWSDQLNHELLMETIIAISVLVQLMLLIPMGSIENERCFSLMNLLKSDLRNRLGEDHLNCCVRVKRCCSGLNDFPLNEALSHWNEMVGRRQI